MICMNNIVLTLGGGPFVKGIIYRSVYEVAYKMEVGPDGLTKAVDIMDDIV